MMDDAKAWVTQVNDWRERNPIDIHQFIQLEHDDLADVVRLRREIIPALIAAGYLQHGNGRYQVTLEIVVRPDDCAPAAGEIEPGPTLLKISDDGEGDLQEVFIRRCAARFVAEHPEQTVNAA